MGKKPDDEQENQQNPKQPKRSRRAHGEGSVSLRKDGRYQAQMTLEDGRRKYFYGETKKEALDKLHQAQDEQRRGILATGPQQKLSDYLNQWLEEVQKPTVRVTSYMKYRHTLDKHILPELGHIQVQKLTAQRLSTFYNKKQYDDELSPKTIRVMHAMLHKALDNAVKWNLVSRNVCNAVTPPRIEKHEIHPLSLEQIQKLLEAAQDQRLEALFVLALVTGMRRGELLGLKWKDLDIAESILQVRRTLIEVRGKGITESEPKTAKGKRSISLPSLAIEALKQHRTIQLEVKLKNADVWQERDFIFCTSHGTPFGTTYITRVFKLLLKKANLPNIRFHDLRHSAATLLLGMGTHPKVVQELLGHSNISMTMDTYSHVMPTMQKDAMTKLNEVIRKKSPYP